MDQIAWIFWLALGVVLIVAEVFTLSFFLLWFGVGAIAAALVAMTGLGFGWQFLTFALVSVGLTLLSRTIFSKADRGADPVKMGMESLPGQIGTVTIGSKGALQEGAVKVFGSEWTAFPSDGESELTEGEKVEVVSVRGSSIYVRPATRELPGWKQD